MRSVVLSVPVWIILGAAAFAQGTANAPPPLPPANTAPALPPSSAAPPQSSAAPPQSSAVPAAAPTPGEQPATLGGQEPISTRSSNLNQQDQAYAKGVAPALPSPDLGANATPVDYLRAAQAALAAGKTGEAQQSLEMAQTRLLDRSVPYGQVNTPINSPAIGTISKALQALGAGDRGQAMQLIQAAIPQAAAAH